MSGEALAVTRIDKWFGANHAVRNASLTVARGTIHALVGENGAGKSTLMNIVYGLLAADGGEVRVAGRPLSCRNPRQAVAAGIGMVHQHFMLVETFTALENLMLGTEGGFLLGPTRARTQARLEALARSHGLELPADVPVSELPVGVRQRVEILKALHRGAELLILDEPTAVLTPPETGQLFAILRGLRDQGRTVILITHKLHEVMALADRVTVMRRGAVVAGRACAETSAAQLAGLMVGRPVSLSVSRGPARPGATVLEATNLRVCDDHGNLRVKDVSFSLRAGEIVGLAGVSGNGQSELLEALAGMRGLASGTLRLHGRALPPEGGADAARGRRSAKVSHVPEDRLRVGLIPAFAAWENSLLGHHREAACNGPLLLHRQAAIDSCRQQMTAYDIRPPEPRLPGRDFSGGNQQKLVLAREIEHAPDLLLVGQPTRGVDIGAIEFIHRRLITLRDQGKAILLVSAELEEILALSDRILVMFDGRLAGNLPAVDADEKRLGLMMTGASHEEANDSSPPSPYPP